MSNFPASLDTFTNPAGTTLLADPTALHNVQHTNANDAILALEQKLGVGVGTPVLNKILVGSGNGTAVWGTSVSNLTLNSPTINSPIGIKQICKTIGTTGTDADYTCDGTDDNVQFQTAFDDINSLGGGALYVKSGTYSFGTTVDIYDNLDICGAGKASIIKAGTAGNFYCFKSGTKSNITIQDISFDANSNGTSTVYSYPLYLISSQNITLDRIYFTGFGDPYGTPTGAGGVAIIVDKIDQMKVVNCTFNSGFDAMYISSGTNILVNSNTFKDVAGCVTVASGANKLIVSNNHMRYEGTPAITNRLIDLGSGSACIVDGNTMINASGSLSGDAVYADITGQKNIISNNHISNCLDTSIDIQSSYTNILNNMVVNSGAGAIGLAGAQFCSIKGNTVINAKVNSAGAGYGISLAAFGTVNASYNNIEGNIIMDNQGTAKTTTYAIFEGTGSGFNAYYGNLMYNMATGSTSFNGTAGTVALNRSY